MTVWKASVNMVIQAEDYLIRASLGKHRELITAFMRSCFTKNI